MMGILCPDKLADGLNGIHRWRLRQPYPLLWFTFQLFNQRGQLLPLELKLFLERASERYFSARHNQRSMRFGMFDDVHAAINPLFSWEREDCFLYSIIHHDFLSCAANTCATAASSCPL
ncbi:hypothetical protein D3C75_1068890 [compost metagenome]